MGFGEQKVKETKDETKTIDPRIAAASQGNLDWLTQQRDKGYTPYEGPRVADLSGGENDAMSMIRQLAGQGGNKYTSQLEGLFGRAANAPAQQVSTTRSIDNVPGQGAGGSTQDYMNPYIDAVLTPQLRDIERQRVEAQKGNDARAAMGGAFGDARSGFQAAESDRNFNNARTDTVGRANSDAFNTAMTLKNTDINRLLDTGKFNSGMNETALQRMLQGGGALQGLGTSNTNMQTGLAQMLAQLGQTGRGIDQGKLDAAYGEYMKRYQAPLDISNMLSGAVANARGNTNTNAVTKGPDNTGFGLLGALGGAALNFAAPGMGTFAGNLFGTGPGAPGNYGGNPDTNPFLNPARYGNVKTWV